MAVADGFFAGRFGVDGVEGEADFDDLAGVGGIGWGCSVSGDA